MSYNLSATEYANLYERYLKRPPSNLLGYAAGKDNDTTAWLAQAAIVDLCAGGGRLSRAAYEMGARRIIAIDSSWSMLNSWDWDKDLPPEKLRKIAASAGDFSKWLKTARTPTVDAVFCQQGINHIFEEQVFAQAAKVLKDGGKFVFNTFNSCPNRGVSMKEYTYGDGSFVEITYLLDNVIYHTQIREGFPPHYTSFLWVSRDEFDHLINAYFSSWERIIEGPTDIYVCTK